MDEEKVQIQSLSLYGILRETVIIILSWKKLFSQITMATIFPLSLLFLGHVQISELFFADMVHHEVGSSFKNPKKFWNSLRLEQIEFLCFKILYVVFFLVLSLVSTSAVVYAVSCTYTRNEIDFFEVMSVVPRVWKRLLVTFSLSLIIVLVYNMTSFSILLWWFGPITNFSKAEILILGPVFVTYMMGFVYISIIWHLASVVSILEEDCGIDAMIKSKAMVKGKMIISAALFWLLNLSFILIQVIFQRFVVFGESFWSRVACGILCFLLLSGFTLSGLIIQTIIYLNICKFYDYKIASKSYFGNHLQIYLGDYAPLRSNGNRLDQY